MKTLSALLAFIRRDFLIEISYRTSFVLQFAGIFFSILIWYFISGILKGPATIPGLEGIDYFSYVLIGLALAGSPARASAAISR